MKSRRTVFLLILVVCSLLALWGCPMKPEETTQPAVEAPREVPPPAPEPAPAPKQEEPKAEEPAPAPEAGLQPIHFDFDKAFIRDDAKPVMKANAEWLKSHPKVKVRIEGNCDERGTIEYNQALGQRRAVAAKKYLATLGVKATRISLISYGKEKPACSEHAEDCWQKNRRDDFVSVE